MEIHFLTLFLLQHCDRYFTIIYKNKIVYQLQYNIILKQLTNEQTIFMLQ
jgi:hypothetical protein